MFVQRSNRFSSRFFAGFAEQQKLLLRLTSENRADKNTPSIATRHETRAKKSAVTLRWSWDTRMSASHYVAPLTICSRRNFQKRSFHFSLPFPEINILIGTRFHTRRHEFQNRGTNSTFLSAENFRMVHHLYNVYARVNHVRLYLLLYECVLFFTYIPVSPHHRFCSVYNTVSLCLVLSEYAPGNQVLGH